MVVTYDLRGHIEKEVDKVIKSRLEKEDSGLISNQDLISRTDAIEAIARVDPTDGTVPVFSGKQVIELLKWNKYIEQEPILDKIRAEIEEQKGNRCFDDEDMYIYMTGLNDAIDIIDKYKESEEME